jgi:hypothetical protein
MTDKYTLLNNLFKQAVYEQLTPKEKGIYAVNPYQIGYMLDRFIALCQANGLDLGLKEPGNKTKVSQTVNHNRAI